MLYSKNVFIILFIFTIIKARRPSGKKICDYCTNCKGILPDAEEIKGLRKNSTKQKGDDDPKPLEEIDNHLSAEQCVVPEQNLYKTVINPYKTSKENSEPDGNIFRSVWLKCAACLAVADKINETFQQFLTVNVCLNKCCHTFDDISDDYFEALKEMCQTTFKTYDLRLYNEHVLVTHASVRSKHVPSKVDGKWAEILQELCSNFVRYMNFSKMVGLYLSNTLDMMNFFCKGDGIFRDCTNLDIPYFRIPEPESKFTFKFYLGR